MVVSGKDRQNSPIGRMKSDYRDILEPGDVGRIQKFFIATVSRHGRSLFFAILFAVIGLIFLPLPQATIYGIQLWIVSLGLCFVFALAIAIYILESMVLRVIRTLDKTPLWPIWFYASSTKDHLAPLTLWIVIRLCWGYWLDKDTLEGSAFSVDTLQNAFDALIIISSLFLARQLLLNMIFWEVESKAYIDKIAEVDRNERILRTLVQRKTEMEGLIKGADPKRFSLKRYESIKAETGKLRKSLFSSRVTFTSKKSDSFSWKTNSIFGHSQQVAPKQEMRVLARDLFDFLSRDIGKDFLRVDDFHRYFDSSEADQVFLQFIREENQEGMIMSDFSDSELKLDKRKFIRAVLRMRQHRLDLVSDLQRSSSASSVLGHFLTGLSWISIPFILAYQFGASTQTIVLTTSSVVLSFAFALGKVISNLVESIYFIFVTKPYTVGDVVLIGSTKAEMFFVQEIQMMTTTFRTLENRLVILPNFSISEGCLVNYNRLSTSSVNVLFRIAFDTPPEKVDELKESFEEFLKHHVNDWIPSSLVFFVLTLDQVNAMDLNVWITHRKKWQDTLQVMLSRAEFLNFARAQLVRLGITYHQITQKLEFDPKLLQGTMNMP